MKNQSKVLTDEDILREFEKRAFQIIKDNWDHFRWYKKEMNQSLIESEEFQADPETVASIYNKYVIKKNIDPELLPEVTCISSEVLIGIIEIEGYPYLFWDDVLWSDEGINVIKKILNLLDIKYQCRCCATRPCCGILEWIDECEGADEVYHIWFNFKIIRDILNFM